MAWGEGWSALPLPSSCFIHACFRHRQHLSVLFSFLLSPFTPRLTVAPACQSSSSHQQVVPAKLRSQPPDQGCGAKPQSNRGQRFSQTLCMSCVGWHLRRLRSFFALDSKSRGWGFKSLVACQSLVPRRLPRSSTASSATPRRYVDVPPETDDDSEQILRAIHMQPGDQLNWTGVVT